MTLLRVLTFVILATSLLPNRSRAEDLSYITDEELAEELNARKDDLLRTTERIETLRSNLLATQHEIEQITQRIQAIDNRLVQKTSMLYRLSRNGKTVQYLFSSNSAITFLKRIQTLKKIITTEMDEKRKASVELSRATNDAVQANDEMGQATQLVEELHLAIDDLRMEQQRRNETAMLAGS